MKIKIGVSEYKLQKKSLEEIIEMWEEKTQEVAGKSFQVLGVCDSAEYAISIGSNITPQAKKQTFFHELVHALLDEIGMAELSNDEGFVDALGKQLYGFYNNNNLDKILSYLEAA